jgi:uncharacterized membrane protein
MTNEKNFSINDALEFAWNYTRQNLNFFIPFMMLVFVVSMIPDLMTEYMQTMHPIWAFLISLVSWVFSMFLSMAAVKISLLSLKNVKPGFAYIASPLSLFSNYLVGVLLYTLIVMGGFFLLIVPGVILGIKYKYIPFLIIQKGLKPIEALHASDAVTQGIKMRLFLFSLLLIAINLGGFFLFFVGMLITVPISWIAEVYVYNELLKQSALPGAVARV